MSRSVISEQEIVASGCPFGSSGGRWGWLVGEGAPERPSVCCTTCRTMFLILASSTTLSAFTWGHREHGNKNRGNLATQETLYMSRRQRSRAVAYSSRFLPVQPPSSTTDADGEATNARAHNISSGRQVSQHMTRLQALQ